MFNRYRAQSRESAKSSDLSIEINSDNSVSSIQTDQNVAGDFQEAQGELDNNQPPPKKGLIGFTC